MGRMLEAITPHYEDGGTPDSFEWLDDEGLIHIYPDPERSPGYVIFTINAEGLIGDYVGLGKD